MAESSNFTPIVLFASETASATPSLPNLAVGELALNITDRKLYTKNSANALVEITNGSAHSHVASDITDFAVEVNELITAANYPRPNVRTETTTARTLSETDENAIIVFTNASAITVTLPENATTELPVGFISHLHQQAAGVITVAGAGAVTVNSSRSLNTAGQYSALSVMKIATDDWVVVGDQE